MSPSPAERIALINRSMRIFTCGAVGALPVLGFVFAVYAVAAWVPICRNREWNPAGKYLSWGMGLALFGIGSTVLLAGGWAVLGCH